MSDQSAKPAPTVDIKTFPEAREMDLRNERATVLKAARDMLDRARLEKRGLSAEEEQEYDRREADVKTLTTEIQRRNVLSECESKTPLTVDLKTGEIERRDMVLPAIRPPTQGEIQLVPPRKPSKYSKGSVAFDTLRSRSYAQAFESWVRYGEKALDLEDRSILQHPELRALGIGTGAGGGFLSPVDLERQVVVALNEQNAMRGISTVLTISHDRDIPVVNDPGDLGDPTPPATGFPTAESAAYPEDDVVFEQRNLRSFKIARLMRVSEELANDEEVGLMGLIPGWFARRFANAEESWFVNGTGTTIPRGFLLDAVEAFVGAAPGVGVTGQEILDLFYALRTPYRRRASWIMSSATTAAIAGIVDNSGGAGIGNFLWQPGLQAGTPDRIKGRPVVESDQMPDIALGATAIALGDFSFYWIADRAPRNFKRLDERYADTGQIGFVMSERVDGVLTVTESIKYITQNAA